MMDVETKFMNDDINDAYVISYCLIRPRGCVFVANAAHNGTQEKYIDIRD